MNETIRTILERRSVRRYKPEQFPRADLDLILQAGLHAPSARNTQAWHLAVIRGAERIDALTREVKAATARMPENKYKDMVGKDGYTVNYHAPTFIIVSVDPAVSAAPEADAALVLGNMFLAARSLGIGSCWINQLNALNDEAAFRSHTAALGVPAKHRIHGCGAFGYPERMPANALDRMEHTVTITGE